MCRHTAQRCLMAEGMAETTISNRSQDRRKLIAVVYADMVGYSRLIGLDDAGTLNGCGRCAES